MVSQRYKNEPFISKDPQNLPSQSIRHYLILFYKKVKKNFVGFEKIYIDFILMSGKHSVFFSCNLSFIQFY